MPGPLGPVGINSSRDSGAVVMLLPCVGSGGARAPILGPARERVAAALDDGAHFRREPNQIADVVERQQAQSEQLARDEQMPQVSARIRRACLTVTARVQGAVVRPELRVANVERSVRRECRAVAPAARGRDAVEQVYAALDRRDEILWKSDAHKITGQD